MIRSILFFGGFVFLSSCATATESKSKQQLYDFAQANCLFWYFDAKGYDTKDIRAISGGIVEKSAASAEDFQKISLFVKDYSPEISSKNDIDEKLNRCFQLRSSEALRALIDGN